MELPTTFGGISDGAPSLNHGWDKKACWIIVAFVIITDAGMMPQFQSYVNNDEALVSYRCVSFHRSIRAFAGLVQSLGRQVRSHHVEDHFQLLVREDCPLVLRSDCQFP